MKRIIEHLKLEWWKYELETLVVKVGILGAFTLNNWNDSRKDKIIEQEIYKNLQTSLRKDGVPLPLPYSSSILSNISKPMTKVRGNLLIV